MGSEIRLAARENAGLTIRAHICIYVYAKVSLYVCIYVYACIHVYVHVYSFFYIW